MTDNRSSSQMPASAVGGLVYDRAALKDRPIVLYLIRVSYMSLSVADGC